MPSPGPDQVTSDDTAPPQRPEVGQEFSAAADRMATGGTAIGTGPDGRIAFISGAIPGETVTARVDAVHRSRLEATLLTVDEASPERTEPGCEHVSDGCGGCDWQHITADGQARFRVAVVDDCLRRLAKMSDVDIRRGPTLPVDGYRTTVRAAVVDGRAAYRKRSSHDLVTVDRCTIAHPAIEELLVEGRFGSATEVVIRVGANTGERLVVADPTAAGIAVPGDLPDDVKLVGRDELAAGARPHYHENIAGLRLQISADSFFQCRPDGARILAGLAGDAVSDVEGPLLDAYCGMGLFGALAGLGRSILGVEVNPGAVADARWNYGPHGRVVESDFERWDPEPAAVVIADPARSGLGKAGAERVAATGATRLALVSCDPASLARDASLLAGYGFELDHVTVVDLFGQTSHVETVSRFVR
jgi:23S rRNA (uracil1939-C5)-methyltransferase